MKGGIKLEKTQNSWKNGKKSPESQKKGFKIKKKEKKKKRKIKHL